MKSLLSLGLLSTAMGVYVDENSGSVVIGGAAIDDKYGSGSIIKHATSVGMFEIKATDTNTIESQPNSKRVHTDLKLQVKLATAAGADASTRINSAASLSYWADTLCEDAFHTWDSGACSDNTISIEAECLATHTDPTNTIALGAVYADGVLISNKRNSISGTSDKSELLTTCVRLNNPDDGNTKYYGDLHVELSLDIAWEKTNDDYVNEAIADDPMEFKDENAEGVNQGIFLSESWSLVVDTNTQFSGTAMDGSNHGLTRHTLQAEAATDIGDKQTAVTVGISSSDMALKVANVDISHQSFVTGTLKGATAVMTIDETKYAGFRRSTQLITAEKEQAVACEPVVDMVNNELTVVCKNDHAHFMLPFDHVKQAYISPDTCSGGLCGGKIVITASGSESGGLQTVWEGAGVDGWENTGQYQCAVPGFTAQPITKDFFSTDSKSLNLILEAGIQKEDCLLSAKYTFSPPTSAEGLVSGCTTGGEITVGDAAANLNHLATKYGQCLVAEPPVYTTPQQSDDIKISIGAVQSESLYHNTENYDYGVVSTSNGATMSASYSADNDIFLQTQVLRVCTLTPTNLDSNTRVLAEETDFEADGGLSLTLQKTDVKFNTVTAESDKNVRNTVVHDDKTLRARCSASESASVSLSCDSSDLTVGSLATEDTGRTFSASIDADITTASDTYVLSSDPTEFAEESSETAYETHATSRSATTYSKTVTYTDGFNTATKVNDATESYSVALSSDATSNYMFNCGNGDGSRSSQESGDVEVHSASNALPCQEDVTLSHTVTTYVKYDSNDLKITAKLVSGKDSIKESTGYGDKTTETIPGALEFTSIAIANDNRSGPATDFDADVSSTAPGTVAGTMSFAASNCQHDDDKIVCDLVISGSRVNIYGDGNEAHTLAFNPKYQHHTTDQQCLDDDHQTLALSSVPCESTDTFTFVKEKDLYRGQIDVRDTDNWKNQGINTNTDGWTYIIQGLANTHVTQAEVINYAIAMDNSPAQKPEIQFEIYLDTAATGCSSLKFFFDATQLDFVPGGDNVHSSASVSIDECQGGNGNGKYQFEENCPDSATNWKTNSNYQTITSTDSENFSPHLKPQEDYSCNPSATPPCSAGNAMVIFNLYVQQCDDVETRRKILLSIDSALETSFPAVGVKVTGGFQSLGSYAYGGSNTTALSTNPAAPTLIEGANYEKAYTKWNEVTLYLQHFRGVGDVQGDKDFEIKNSLCALHGFSASDDVHNIGTGASATDAITFVKENSCENIGVIGFNFDGVCYYVGLKCKRHATSSSDSFTISLDYGVTFTNDVLSVAADTAKTVDLGTGAVCNPSGAVSPATKAECTGLSTTIASGFPAIVSIFDDCGQPSEITDGTKWEMPLVQGITKGSQFCNARDLSLSLVHKGRDTASLLVDATPELEISLSLTNFEYQACSTGHQIAFKIEDNSAATISAENSMVTIGGVSQTVASQFDLTSGTGTSYVASYVSPCQDYCGESQSVLAFDFDAKGSDAGQDFYVDVSGSLTLNGDPCTGSPVTSDLTAVLKSAAMDQSDCKSSSLYTPAISTVTTDSSGCFKLSPESTAYASDFTAGQASLKSGTAGNLVLDTTLILSSAKVGDDYYYTITNLVSAAGKEVELTVEWEYEITGGRRLRATSTYLLGSSDHHSSAGLRILPAGVQIQEQIEAAPAHDVIYNGTVLNTTDDDLPDHEHINANWGLGLGITGSVVGVGFIAVWIYTGWKRTQNGRDFLGVKSGYQKVGRFQSNMAF
tara:strand:+ start:14647 stop:19908 length:5262 start_codon:yes stop_codon:yes gene_type:complete